MVNVLKAAAEWLHEVRHDKLASEVVYQRASGGDPLELMATPCRLSADQVVESEFTSNANQRDFIFRKADFVVASEFVAPVRLDRLTVVDSGDVWEVAEIAGEPCWRDSDEFENAVRVHAVRG